MSSSKPQNVKGLVIVDEVGSVMVQLGAGLDPRLVSMVSDPDWMTNAVERRIVAVLLTDAQYMALITVVEGGRLVLFFDGMTDTVVRFFSQVDFAIDIIDHILSDPYDAMAIIDSKSRLVFVSPVHEKFFGLKTGEGAGRNVRDVIQNTRLHHVVRTGIAEVGQIQKMCDSERVVSRHPIRHDGMVVGAIGRVMFKGPQQVEALSRRINVLEKEIASYRTERKVTARAEAFLGAIVGQSRAVEAVRDQIRKVAPLDIPVLIQGETGTGKELVARALHAMSPRSVGRLVTVNAAALPASLVESELFGYEPGSFTGADSKGRRGKFEQADKGTIFLDEIGDMPLEVQSKLLRVLQDRIVERVGGENPRQVDFRLCSATNRDLEKFIEEERFRMDLFYRISPVIIRMPTLAERIEDIPLLVVHFLEELCEQYSRPMPEVEDAVHDVLMERQWPGNVRELRHVIERAFVFSEPGWLRAKDILSTGRANPAPRAAGVPQAAPDLMEGGSLKDVLGELERKLIADRMIRFNGNKKKVAEHLGVSRSYLYKKLEDDSG